MDHEPAFILVRPQMGENIGAAARAMLNFGLTRMRLVAPRDGWPNPKAVAMASGASRVLEHAGVFADIAGAIADCHHVYATTARPRELTHPVLTPAEAMADARARIAAGERVAILFGPERAGLETADVAQAQSIITVPANPDFPSLNLAQCALLCAYDWARAEAPPPVARLAEPAPRAEVEHLARHMEEDLEAAGFFFPPGKAESMRANLRAMWARLPLGRADVQTLHGILRKLARRGGDGGGGGDGPALRP
ncbi:MAG: RNA methyltransferase [Gemmobacter sp.]